MEKLLTDVVLEHAAVVLDGHEQLSAVLADEAAQHRVPRTLLQHLWVWAARELCVTIVNHSKCEFR